MFAGCKHSKASGGKSRESFQCLIKAAGTRIDCYRRPWAGVQAQCADWGATRGFVGRARSQFARGSSRSILLGLCAPEAPRHRSLARAAETAHGQALKAVHVWIHWVSAQAHRCPEYQLESGNNLGLEHRTHYMYQLQQKCYFNSSHGPIWLILLHEMWHVSDYKLHLQNKRSSSPPPPNFQLAGRHIFVGIGGRGGGMKSAGGFYQAVCSEKLVKVHLTVFSCIPTCSCTLFAIVNEKIAWVGSVETG